MHAADDVESPLTDIAVLATGLDLQPADQAINVVDMLNKSRVEVAYNLIDIQTIPSDDLIAEIRAIEGVINVRIFEFE